MINLIKKIINIIKKLWNYNENENENNSELPELEPNELQKERYQEIERLKARGLSPREMRKRLTSDFGFVNDEVRLQEPIIQTEQCFKFIVYIHDKISGTYTIRLEPIEQYKNLIDKHIYKIDTLTNGISKIKEDFIKQLNKAIKKQNEQKRKEQRREEQIIISQQMPLSLSQNNNRDRACTIMPSRRGRNANVNIDHVRAAMGMESQVDAGLDDLF